MEIFNRLECIDIDWVSVGCLVRDIYECVLVHLMLDVILFAILCTHNLTFKKQKPLSKLNYTSGRRSIMG